MSRCLVVDLVGFGEVEDTGLDKGLDGPLDEFRIGFVFEGGLDFVFQSLASGRAGFGGVCEFGLNQGKAFVQSPEGRDFCERRVAGNALLFALEVAHDRIEVSVLGDDVEIALGISGDHAAEFEGEHEVERIAAIDRSLDNPHLLGMILGEEEERGWQFGMAGAEDHEHPHRFAADPGKIGFTDVLVVDEDVLGAGHEI